MKNLLYILVIFLAFSGCKKVTFPSSFVGTWEFNSLINEPNSGPLKLFQNNSEIHPATESQYGRIELEITSDSKFIFTSKKGKQKFKVVGYQKIARDINVYQNNGSFVVEINSNENVTSYTYELRASNGDLFKFNFYFDEFTQRIITVPWVKGLSYFSKNAPYSFTYARYVLGVKYGATGYGYSFGEIGVSDSHQILADFNRKN